MTAIFYAIVISIVLTTETNYYYTYDSSDAYLTVNSDLEIILSDEVSFTCNGRTYYLNNTGPLKGRTADYSTRTDFLAFAPHIGFAMLSIFIFVLTRLAMGRYNQLLLLVKFREQTHSGEIVPDKLSVAFTILCNMSKLVSVQYDDLCGRRAMVSDQTASSTERYLATLVYVVCWSTILIWFSFLALTCGVCCTGPTDFWAFRRFIVIASLILTAMWVVNFDPALEFNFDDLSLFFVNVVSMTDLVLSAGYDIYLKCK